MAPHATGSAAPSGWWHGHDSDVVASAADAFGLSIDALRLLSGLKAIGVLLSEQEAAAWAGPREQGGRVLVQTRNGGVFAIDVQ